MNFGHMGGLRRCHAIGSSQVVAAAVSFTASTDNGRQQCSSALMVAPAGTHVKVKLCVAADPPIVSQTGTTQVI